MASYPYGYVQRLLVTAANTESDDCIILTPRNGRMREVWMGNGKTTDAHRAVWTIKHGAPPDGLFVLHTCSEGSSSFGCINPHHLRLGTVRENAVDREQAGRGNHRSETGGHGNRSNHPSGELSATAKLTEAAVRAIRSRYVRGAKFPHSGNSRVLAEEFGITKSAVMHVVKRHVWTHI